MRDYYVLGHRWNLPSGLILTAGLAALLAAAPAIAATWEWTGDSGNNSWNNSGNWNPVSQPANNGTADVSFGGTDRLTPDLTLPWNVNAVNFLSSAGAFNLFSTLGNTLTVGAGGSPTTTRTTRPSATRLRSARRRRGVPSRAT
jgi:hypothetical protein